MGKSTGDKHPQACVAGMVLIRLFLGAFLLFSAGAKLFTPAAPPPAPGATPPAPPPAPMTMDLSVQSMNPAPFIEEVGRGSEPDGLFVQGNVLPEYAAFLTGTVRPNAELFGWLIICGEVGVGVLLLVGLLTRVAALIGLLMSAAYLLATMHISLASFGVNAAFAAMQLAVLIAGPGKTLGIDGLFSRRKAAKKKSKDEE